jgi:alpha-ketoglutarate-dependent taurine dioxygenase
MNICSQIAKCTSTVPCTASNNFFKAFQNFGEMYDEAQQDEFTGVGILNHRYDLNSLDQDITTKAAYFSDQVFGKIREIKFTPGQTHSIAESCGAHPLHTDATFSERPLERFALSFRKTDPGQGGVSTIFPISWILDAIPDVYRDALETSHVVYTRKSEKEGDRTYCGPILSWINPSRPVFRWRYDDKVMPVAVDAKGLPIRDAVEWVKTFIAQTPPLFYAAQEGDTLLIDNGKVMHGRTKLTPNSSRIAYRAWLA